MGGLTNLHVLSATVKKVVNVMCSCINSSNGLLCCKQTGDVGCLSELQYVLLDMGALRSMPFPGHCRNVWSLYIQGGLNPYNFIQGGISLLRCLEKLEVLSLVLSVFDLKSMAFFHEILSYTLFEGQLRLMSIETKLPHHLFHASEPIER